MMKGRQSVAFTTKTILVVDDDVGIQRFFQIGFSRYPDYRLIIAHNGAQGLEMAMQEMPVVVIIDMNMPELRGEQLILALRGDLDTAAIPLIILSARVTAKDHLLGKLAGCDRYLEKPVTMQEVIAAIEEVLLIRESERAARMAHLADGGKG
jgi:DNA-binding response OmpR family regulator